MSILDDAIREHLELKRQHGADDAELKRLEDEAFGPPARPDETPDPFAEAPTEFMATEGGEEQDPGEAQEPEGQRQRSVQIADLQEAPEPPPAAEPETGEPELPAEEEQPAMEHETVPAPEAEIETGPTTEDRHAIAEQPTEMFDVEGEFASSEAEAPSEEQLLEAELSEPRLAPAPPVEEEPEDEFDEFFSEERLSDELNKALEAPVDEVEETELAADEHDEEEPSGEFEVVDASEDDEEELEDDEGEYTEEHEVVDQAKPEPAHEDVLEDTPDFLEDAPEDDNLWFEQRPPKDFDFDD